MNDAIDRRIEEILEEIVLKLGPRRTGTKIDTIYAQIREEFRLSPDTALWEAILVEVAKRVGVYMTVQPTPAAVADARDNRAPKLRWEMLAVMVKGDPSANPPS